MKKTVPAKVKAASPRKKGNVFQSSKTQKSYRLWGEVVLDKPLIGATISVIDTKGRQLFEEKNATYITGSFLLNAHKVPGKFFIIAEHGTLNGKPFNGTVTKLVHKYDKNDYYILNALTTLLANYHSKKPEANGVHVEEKLKNLLDIPAHTDICQVIDICGRDTSVFDHSQFMNEVDSSGNFNGFVDELTNEMENDNKRSFVPMQLSFVALGAVATFVGSELASGALSWIGGEAASWVFSSLGYKSSADQAQEECRQKLDAISKQLDNIMVSLDKVDTLQADTLRRIDKLSDALMESYKGLKWENEIRALQSQSSNIVTILADPISRISVFFKHLQRFSKVDPDKVDKSMQEFLEKTMDEILSSAYGLELNLEKLNRHITGDLGEKGLLDIWSNFVALGANSNNLNELYRAFENHFAYLFAMELIGIAVSVDAYHGKYGSDNRLVELFWQDWKEKLKGQIDMFLGSVEKIFASRIDSVTGTGFNAFVDSPHPKGFEYSGALLFPRADQFAREMLNSLEISKEQSGGFVTVRIINFPNVLKKIDQVVDVELKDNNSDKTYTAVSIVRKDNQTIPDKDFKIVNYELIIFNFAVPFGIYRPSSMFYYGIGMDNNTQLTLTNDCRYESCTVMAYRQKLKTYSVFSTGEDRASRKPIMHGVTISGGGKVYVLSAYTIVKFTAQGDVVDIWGMAGGGMSGSRSYDFAGPSAITTDQDQNVYIADGNGFKCRIQKYNPDGKLIKQWGSKGQGDGNFHSVADIATGSGGYLYTIDSVQCLLQKFDLNGKFIKKWGARGSENGQFSLPTSIATDGSGNVYVSDKNNCNIQKFDSEGRFITKWGASGSDDGQLLRPSGLAVDKGRKWIYVADSGNRCVHIFDLNGSFIRKYDVGEALNGFNEARLAVDNDTGTLFLVDQKKNELQVWHSLTFVSRNW